MSAHLTEEEQIEALKRWWSENGKMTVALILAAVIGWFGWSSWQDRQAQLAQQASDQYAELMTVMTVGQGESLSEEQEATARLIAAEITESRPKSLYGNMAALLLAKLAMDKGDLAEAESRVRGVISNAANASMAKLANLRLARIVAAQGDREGALALLDSDIEEAYRAAYAEARGDIYFAQQQLELAHQAYEQALANLGADNSNRRGLIEIKRDNAQIATDGIEEAPEAAATAEGDA